MEKGRLKEKIYAPCISQGALGKTGNLNGKRKIKGKNICTLYLTGCIRKNRKFKWKKEDSREKYMHPVSHRVHEE
jgi:hypothetical protein